MKANIYLKGDKVTCNIIDCEGIATFKWFYQFNENYKLNRIGNNSNIIGWLGFGTYICEATCGETLVVSNTFEKNPRVSKVNVLSLPGPSKPERVVVNNSIWDFTKIPPEYNEPIKELVRLEKWKELAQIHNKHQVSNNNYCCNMDDVKKNFIKYVEMLGEKSEVVQSN